MRSGFVTTSIGKLHYRECGHGDALLLLHPAPRSSRVYGRLMPLITRARALSVDLPGFGESCDLPQGATMESIADTVCEFMDALGIERAHVFGLHSGNKIAAARAATAPHRLHGLILAGMRHSILLDGAARNTAMRHYVENKWPVPRELDPSAFDDEQVDRQQGRRAYDLLYAANYAFDFGAAIKRIRARTLVLELRVPFEDGLGSPGEELCSLIPQARLIALPFDDRELLQARPAELTSLIDTFLQSTSPHTHGAGADRS